MRKAVGLHPDNAYENGWAHFNLGKALSGQNKLREAEAAFSKAIALQPKLAGWHFELGLVLEKLGKARVAEDAYRKAIELKKDYADAYCNIG